MNSESFTYWLQGFVELTESDGGSPHISEKQWLVIKDHLKLVFDKKTPDRSQRALDWNTIGIKPVDLIGKQVDPSYWQYPYSPVITC